MAVSKTVQQVKEFASKIQVSPQTRHSGRREPTARSCPLTSTHVSLAPKRNVNSPEGETEVSQAPPMAQEGQASKGSEGSAAVLALSPPVGLRESSQGQPL